MILVLVIAAVLSYETCHNIEYVQLTFRIYCSTFPAKTFDLFANPQTDRRRGKVPIPVYG